MGCSRLCSSAWSDPTIVSSSYTSSCRPTQFRRGSFLLHFTTNLPYHLQQHDNRLERRRSILLTTLAGHVPIRRVHASFPFAHETQLHFIYQGCVAARTLTFFFASSSVLARTSLAHSFIHSPLHRPSWSLLPRTSQPGRNSVKSFRQHPCTVPPNHRAQHRIGAWLCVPLCHIGEAPWLVRVKDYLESGSKPKSLASDHSINVRQQLRLWIQRHRDKVTTSSSHRVLFSRPIKCPLFHRKHLDDQHLTLTFS